MTEQTPRPAAFCPSCGGALAPDGTHRPGRSRTIALVLLLVPMGVGLLGIHRIYMGLRSGWIMLASILLAPATPSRTSAGSSGRC